MGQTIHVLMPLSIDRWRSSIATQMRAVVEANPEIRFYAFSSPVTEEDRAKGREFWRRPNVTRVWIPDIFLRRFDLVQLSHMGRHNRLVARLAKLRGAGKTSVLSVICLQFDDADLVAMRNFRLSIGLVDHFFAVSKVAGLCAEQEVPERYLGAVKNGFDDDFMDPVLADPADLPEETADLPRHGFVLWVSSLEDRKRPDFLVRIARRLPSVTFVAVGYVDGVHSQPHLAAIRKQPNIRWLGLVERRVLRALYDHAGVLFFPSEREGLPLAVIESSGMGLPVLAQPASSLPEIIREGFNGHLLSIEDEEAWVSGIREALSMSPEQRAASSGKVRKWAIAEHSWGAVGRRYGEIYRKVLDRP